MDKDKLTPRPAAGDWAVVTSGYMSLDHMIQLSGAIQVGYTAQVMNDTHADVQYGGCSVNIAHHLCRLACSALPILRVGDDPAGADFVAFLKRAHIPTDAVTVLPTARTSTCYLLQNDRGEHITLFYPGAMDGRYAQPLSDDWFASAKLGVMTVGAPADNEQFLAMCRHHNLPLAFSMKGDFQAFPTDFLKRILEQSRWVFTNAVERDSLEQRLGYSMQAWRATAPDRVLITTRGAAGCWIDDGSSADGQPVSLPSYRGIEVVDTTGGGDGFVAGYLYGYLQGCSPVTSAALGTCLSSFILEGVGCCTHAPTASELWARLDTYVTQLDAAMQPLIQRERRGSI